MSTIYEKAIKLLKIRPHHSAELTKKLLMRGFSRDQIDDVIKKLQEENLIDNDRFAQMYLDELLRNKTFGFYGLKAKLMTRGIDSQKAETLLKENLSVEDELKIAQKVAERSKDLDKNKLAQRLQRKGFRNEVIIKIVNSLHTL
jgi:regulatory protein